MDIGMVKQYYLLYIHDTLEVCPLNVESYIAICEANCPFH